MKDNEETPTERPYKHKPQLPFLVDSVLSVQKIRVASQVRKSHLARHDRFDPDTNEVLKRLEETEEWLDKRIAELVHHHPAYSWFSRVKGIGDNNIAKVVGLIDISIPGSPSSLWKFAGYGVDNGQAPKRVRGAGKLPYNSELRTMCYRLGESLMRSGGKFHDYYVEERAKYIERYRREGKKIVPAASLPKGEDGKRRETPEVISLGHVHMQAFRKMIKLFLSCLWQVWREAEGFPTRVPYPIEYLGHEHIVDPWSMVDREEKKISRRV